MDGMRRTLPGRGRFLHLVPARVPDACRSYPGPFTDCRRGDAARAADAAATSSQLDDGWTQFATDACVRKAFIPRTGCWVAVGPAAKSLDLDAPELDVFECAFLCQLGTISSPQDLAPDLDSPSRDGTYVVSHCGTHY